ncbi:MAG: S-adenosylmethionine:tRNA ribosyltransferase-isomerase, partial [Bacteroidota bacterium]
MLETLRNIRIEDFDYPLPADQIAQFPLEVRDSSKLLVLSGNAISEGTFTDLASHLPAGSLLVLNETR